MSKVTRVAGTADDADGPAAPGGDRRRNERQIATFRTCCVVVDGQARPAILRNISDGGAMFEVMISAVPDTHITYWWDGIETVDARIAWVEGNRIGVANLSGPANTIIVPRPRATRVPICLPVRIWADGKERWAETVNISMSGLAVTGLEDAEPGMLCTIEVGGQALHNACIVRCDDGITGIKFERALAPARLMQLLGECGPAAQGATQPAATQPAATVVTPVTERGTITATRTHDRNTRREADTHAEPEPGRTPPGAPIPPRRFL